MSSFAMYARRPGLHWSFTNLDGSGAVGKTAGLSKNCPTFIQLAPLNMVSKSYRLCRQSGRKSIFASACRPSSSVGINIGAQIIRFDVFLHAGRFFFSNRKKILTLKEKRRGLP